MIYLGPILGTVALLAGLAIRDRFANEPWLPWLAINIGLAWVPLVLSGVAESGRLALLLVAPVWLLFLPNGPYIVTDLMYLRERPNASIWFDVVPLAAAAMLGMWLGILSLHQMAGALPVPACVTCASASMVVGLGVYLGRAFRWNSWDLFKKPGLVLREVLNLVLHPIENSSAWISAVTFGMLFCV